MAPVIFGPDWLKSMLSVLSMLAGLVLAAAMLQKFDAVIVWCDNDFTVGKLRRCRPSGGLPDSDSDCAALVGLQLLGAAVLAVFVHNFRSVAFFAIGAAAAGFAAFVASGFAVELLTQVPLPAEALALLTRVEDGDIVVAIVGVTALVGGLLVGTYKDALIDFSLGLVGGMLVAQGAMKLLEMDVLTAELKHRYKADQFYMAYFSVCVVLTQLIRYMLISIRGVAFVSASEQIDSEPGATLIAKAARVSPAKASAAAKPPGSMKRAKTGMY